MKQKLIKCIEVNKLAKTIDMSPRWIKDKVKAGELLGYRLGNRIVVDLQSVDDFMAAREMRLIRYAVKGRAKVSSPPGNDNKNLP